MRTLSLAPPRSYISSSYIEKDLVTCSHVYLLCDRVHRPLELPYDGPFRIIAHGTQTFRIHRRSCEEVVSVDRIKAAVPGPLPEKPCGPLHPAASPHRSSIPMSCMIRFPPGRNNQLPPHPAPTLHP
ncbi:unnamed protein product [Schistocephalus solidus]|uniref:Uncharacterized protein n=1 Tax=Schistocephalus solidus TaxID=70667 RepID=A0A183TLN4_SCHSO|nr:unnamed protein product [Schistocephalus solidus]